MYTWFTLGLSCSILASPCHAVAVRSVDPATATAFNGRERRLLTSLDLIWWMMQIYCLVPARTLTYWLPFPGLWCDDVTLMVLSFHPGSASREPYTAASSGDSFHHRHHYSQHSPKYPSIHLIFNIQHHHQQQHTQCPQYSIFWIQDPVFSVQCAVFGTLEYGVHSKKCPHHQGLSVICGRLDQIRQDMSSVINILYI